MNKFASAIIFSSALIAIPAWAADGKAHSETKIDTNADGTYKGSSTFESTDSAGTTIKSKVEENETIGLTGKRKTSARVETVQDPKGLGNKSWAKGESNTVTDAHGNVTRDTEGRAVNADGTMHNTDETVKSSRNADGSSEMKLSKKEVIDPKGLMNRQTVKTEEIVKHAANGAESRTVKKELNGKTVQEETTVR
jgi:hypothetical protein